MRLRDYTEAIDKLREEGYKPKEIISRLKSFLTRRQAPHVMGEIIRAYERRAAYGYHPDILKVETAHEVKKETLEGIRKAAGAPAETSVVHMVKTEHIGGYSALYGNRLIEATIESRLRALRRKLLKLNTTT